MRTLRPSQKPVSKPVMFTVQELLNNYKSQKELDYNELFESIATQHTNSFQQEPLESNSVQSEMILSSKKDPIQVAKSNFIYLQQQNIEKSAHFPESKTERQNHLKQQNKSFEKYPNLKYIPNRSATPSKSPFRAKENVSQNKAKNPKNVKTENKTPLRKISQNASYIKVDFTKCPSQSNLKTQANMKVELSLKSLLYKN
ncbi:hypothetical protein pb186bvf_001127 [Paramecium bursaria]